MGMVDFTSPVHPLASIGAQSQSRAGAAAASASPVDLTSAPSGALRSHPLAAEGAARAGAEAGRRAKASNAVDLTNAASPPAMFRHSRLERGLGGEAGPGSSIRMLSPRKRAAEAAELDQQVQQPRANYAPAHAGASSLQSSLANRMGFGAGARGIAAAGSHSTMATQDAAPRAALAAEDDALPAEDAELQAALLMSMQDAASPCRDASAAAAAAPAGFSTGAQDQSALGWSSGRQRSMQSPRGNHAWEGVTSWLAQADDAHGAGASDHQHSPPRGRGAAGAAAAAAPTHDDSSGPDTARDEALARALQCELEEEELGLAAQRGGTMDAMGAFADHFPACAGGASGARAPARGRGRPRSGSGSGRGRSRGRSSYTGRQQGGRAPPPWQEYGEDDYGDFFGEPGGAQVRTGPHHLCYLVHYC
jgi:hypothetical protein